MCRTNQASRSLYMTYHQVAALVLSQYVLPIAILILIGMCLTATCTFRTTKADLFTQAPPLTDTCEEMHHIPEHWRSRPIEATDRARSRRKRPIPEKSPSDHDEPPSGSEDWSDGSESRDVEHSSCGTDSAGATPERSAILSELEMRLAGDVGPSTKRRKM